jgi:hypothetical protein
MQLTAKPVFRVKMFSLLYKNAIAYYNAGVEDVNSKVVGLASAFQNYLFSFQRCGVESGTEKAGPVVSNYFDYKHLSYIHLTHSHAKKSFGYLQKSVCM